MNSNRIVYTRDRLLELRLADSKPAAATRDVLNKLTPRQGCRGGRAARPGPDCTLCQQRAEQQTVIKERDSAARSAGQSPRRAV